MTAKKLRVVTKNIEVTLTPAPLSLPQVDLNYWLGGPPESPVRFSVVYRKGLWEVWDLSRKDASRFSKLADKKKALKLISSWAKQLVVLQTEVEPTIVFPVAGVSTRRRIKAT
jgi:hypothetical protein